MSISLPNGVTIAIASSYADAVAISAISNAKPGIVTATHMLLAGDLIELTTGWARLTDKIVRVSAPSDDFFALEGMDTSRQAHYPAGGSTGAFRKITGWTQLPQILSSTSNGGEQKFLEYQFLESESERRIPTSKSAAGLALSVADDPSLPGYMLASEANDDRLPRAVRISLPSGSVLLYNAYISLNKTPSLTVNEIMACEVTLSLLAEPVRY